MEIRLQAKTKNKTGVILFYKLRCKKSSTVTGAVFLWVHEGEGKRIGIRAGRKGPVGGGMYQVVVEVERPAARVARVGK